MSDNDDTVEASDIDAILNKYKIFEPSETPNPKASSEEVINLDTSDEEDEEQRKVSIAEAQDEVDDILNELSNKYNIDFNKASQGSSSGSSSTSPILYSKHFKRNSPAKRKSPILKPSPSNSPEKNNVLLPPRFNLPASKSPEIQDSISPSKSPSNYFNRTPSFNSLQKSPANNSDDFLNTVYLNTEDNLLNVNRICDPDNAKKRKSKSPKSNELTKIEKAKAQLEKQRERQNKKEELERAKEIKKAMQAANKAMKPEECIKYVTTLVDSEIINSQCGSEIVKTLEGLGAKCSVASQVIPNTITWTRKSQSHLLNDEGKLALTSTTEEVDQMLLLLKWEEVVSLVDKKALLDHVVSIQGVFDSKRISLAIYGIETYFRNFKKKKDKTFASAPEIKRKDLEFALCELQIICSCCYRFVECAQDLASMVAQFTKSIAQAPYKLEKHEKHAQMEWYMSGDNKDCVKVDKDGNGLKRLWQQQLTCFPLARIETAEGIISKYPTLIELIEAYDNCESESDKEKLLQDIPIRRAAGPLTSIRRIGPELSRKVYTFFNSLDREVIL